MDTPKNSTKAAYGKVEVALQAPIEFCASVLKKLDKSLVVDSVYPLRMELMNVVRRCCRLVTALSICSRTFTFQFCRAMVTCCMNTCWSQTTVKPPSPYLESETEATF